MKEGQRLWSRDELILAINLYSKLTFGQMSQRNTVIVELAELIGRTPASVAYKLVNFASLDPQLKQRGIKGMSNASKLDKAIWQEYLHQWDEQYIEGEKLLASKKHTTIEKLYDINLDDLKDIKGKERERKVKVRINQHLFRGIVLSNYNNKCCITGINIPELIVASHILPWSKDEGNRLNPKNGLALNTLHDKAFDCGLLTVTEDLKIKISSKLLNNRDIESINYNFIQYEGKQLIEPKKFYPNVEFLKIHNERFKA
jgi:putative restriction endonuclease